MIPIEASIEYCIKQHILEKFLRERGSEVTKEMAIDMTFERREVLIREEGEKIGEKKERIDLIRKKLNKGKTLDAIADELESTVEKIKPIYDEIIKYPMDTDPDEII